ncbi:MAG: HD domain-containing protein [Thermoleophilia bacterium]|nr:HD domain-containing protein [Thermoleophilia bacterium]
MTEAPAHPLDQQAAARRLAPLRQAITDALDGDDARQTWIVGGTVRDALLDRPLLDVDLVTAGSSEALARRISRAVQGTAFPLGDDHGCWRIACAEQPGDARWAGVLQVDICELRGADLAADLAARDFTINALAMPIAGDDLAIIDTMGGLDDLAARIVRMVSVAALDDDPLRLLRAARFAHVLHAKVDAATAEAIRDRAARSAEPAGERTWVELRLLLLNGEARRGWRMVADLGLEPHLLPELHACRGVTQSDFHHLDVYEHTLAVLDNAEDMMAAPDFWLPIDEPGLEAAPFTEAQRLVVLLAALCHDLAKPATRSERPDGRVGFGGHDRIGMELVDVIAERWRLSNAVRGQVRRLVGTHLALGYLLHGSGGARELYRFRRQVEPVAAEAVVLSIADRMATSGVADRRTWLRRHLVLGRRAWASIWREAAEGRLVPLLDGTGIAEALGIAPGPQLGVLVAALAEEQAVGAVTTADEARDFVRDYDLSESTTRSPSGST